jgi:hypothetical protein
VLAVAGGAQLGAAHTLHCKNHGVRISQPTDKPASFSFVRASWLPRSVSQILLCVCFLRCTTAWCAAAGCLQLMALHPCMMICWVSVLCRALLCCIVMCVALTVLVRLSWSWLLLCRDRQFTLVPIMVGAISTDRSVCATSVHPVCQLWHCRCQALGQ